MKRCLLSLCCLGLMFGFGTFTLVGCGEEEEPAAPAPDSADASGTPPYAQPGAGRTPTPAPSGNQ